MSYTALQAGELLDAMATGEMGEEKMAALLKEIAERGESVDEMVGMARGLRKHMTPIARIEDTPLMDTCGTGGSGLSRMNISTTASFILAAAGVKIAKHGNRSASSRSGSFDLLEALGVNIQMPGEDVSKAIKEVGIGCIFAQQFHPAMKRIAPVRRQLGIRTIFNLVGPLANPMRPEFHFMGTVSKEIADKLIETMKRLEYTRAMVVAGSDGLDDVTLTGPTYVTELRDGIIHSYEFSPEEIGLSRVAFDEISGGTPAENAVLFIQLLQNAAPPVIQNLLFLNAGFGFYMRGFAPSIEEGVALAKKTVESGEAYQKFLDYKEFSNKVIYV